MKLPANLVDDLLSARRASAFQLFDKAPLREWVQVNRTDPQDYSLDLAIIQAAADLACFNGELRDENPRCGLGGRTCHERVMVLTFPIAWLRVERWRIPAHVADPE